MSCLNLDRAGVFASVFCAIHCAAAPALILAAPAFGGMWTHPITHLAIASFVLPVAGITLRKGFRSHGRTWVIAVGLVGMVLVAAGAALPYFAASAPEASHAACDACCPSFVVSDTGEKTLNVPSASIVTLVGGAMLVLAHLTNLRCCSRPTSIL